MANYAKKLPRDVTGEAMQDYPAPVIALEQYNTENAVVSSVISLNPDTTSIEVGAFGGQGLVIRWVPLTETAAVAPRASVVASGLGANFDHHIPNLQVRKFVVPRETQGTPLTAGAQTGSVNGLYQRVAVINAGATASSVLLSEF